MSQFSRSKKRPVKECPNPIFEQWIMEWKEDAETKNSKMKFVYARALQSLRMYPLPLSTGKECSLLEGFGPHLCKMIENKMVKEDMIPASQPDATSSSSLPFSVLDVSDKPLPGTNKRKQVNSDAASKTKGKKKDAGQSRSSSQSSYQEIDFTEDGPGLSQSPPTVPRKKQKQYVPVFRSGAYALLMALHKKENEPDYRGYMTKTELQRDAQEYCDSSFDRPDPGKNTHYTAWSSMAGLLNKDLVFKRGNPAQFFLSPDGRDLAQKLASAENREPSPSPFSQQTFSDEPVVLNLSDQENLSEPETDNEFITTDVKLASGRFEIVLYVDTCETNGRATKPQEIVNELQKNGVTVFVQRLSVGDFVWVCREKADKSSNRNRLTMSASKELILPYVVERKRSDDLAHSIKDGRYHEQKHRLTQTKLNVIYLVESYGKGEWGLREGALGQAMANTQIINDFLVQETSSLKDTCAFLTLMTRHIKTLYEKKTVIGVHKANYQKDAKPLNRNEKYLMLFNDFNDFAVKKTQWTTKEMFARQLLKMKGLSPDKAFAIISKYPTLHDLLQAYSDCTTDAEKQSLLANLNYGATGRRIGRSISGKVSRFYTTTDWS